MKQFLKKPSIKICYITVQYYGVGSELSGSASAMGCVLQGLNWILDVNSAM